MDNLSKILQYIGDIFTSRLPFFPSNIRIALFIILFCVIAFSEQYVYIFFRRINQYYQQLTERKWKENISNMIAHIIVYGEDEETEAILAHFLPRFLKLPLYRPVVKRILCSELLTYHANFTGKTSEILRELYIRLKLDKEARRNINSRYWEKQVKAIRELTQMAVREAAENILKYTDDEQAQLRMEAQAAFVKLSAEKPFRFLDRAKERILNWHQLVLFEVITKTENIEIPSFSRWLNSKNPTVVTLCLKLIGHYQQFDAVPKLILLLKHPYNEIRKLTIKTLGNLEAEMAEEALYLIYNKQPLELKLAVLNAMEKIASGNYLRFLQQQTHVDDFKIRMHAFRAIKACAPRGMEILNSLLETEGGQNGRIIKHVLDERIKA